MITIEHWNEERWPNGELAIKASTFVRYNRKRVDPWFARYVQGQEAPHHPMPAIPLTFNIFPDCVEVLETYGTYWDAWFSSRYDGAKYELQHD